MTTLKELEAKLKIQAEKVTQLLQAAEVALNLEDYEPHIQRLTEILALVKGDIKTYAQAATKWKEQRAIKTNGNRPLPSFVSDTSISVASEILEGTGLKEALEQDAEAHAARLAETVARAPFDGVSKRAEQIAQQAEAAETYGAHVLDEKVTGKLNDPAFVSKIVADIQKKREASK